MTTLLPMTRAKTKIRNPIGNPADDEDIAFSEGIARRVVTLCEMRGFTFRDVERIAGVSDGTVAQLVSGKRAGSTTLKLVWRIARALGTSVDFLCDGRTTAHRGRGPNEDDGASQTAFQFESGLAPPTRSRPRLKSRRPKPPR